MIIMLGDESLDLFDVTIVEGMMSRKMIQHGLINIFERVCVMR